jgi:hypothetical protein
MKLWDKAIKAEYMLDLVIDNQNIPPEEADANIRYVVEDEQLSVSALVLDALLHQAVHGTELDLEVRRLAWRSSYRQLGQGHLLATNKPAKLRPSLSPSQPRASESKR